MDKPKNISNDYPVTWISNNFTELRMKYWIIIGYSWNIMDNHWIIIEYLFHESRRIVIQSMNCYPIKHFWMSTVLNMIIKNEFKTLLQKKVILHVNDHQFLSAIGYWGKSKTLPSHFWLVVGTWLDYDFLYISILIGRSSSSQVLLHHFSEGLGSKPPTSESQVLPSLSRLMKSGIGKGGHAMSSRWGEWLRGTIFKG